jgi:hypothetical protein
MVVPFMAQYAFPSQANKSVKMTPRIPTKNGFVFTPGIVFRLEFPAQGYVNPLTTSLSFDVSVLVPNPVYQNDAGVTGGQQAVVRFQNNIQSIFSRVRLLYGANPLEDIINYNVIVRNLTEWTAGNPSATIDQGTIADGIGNTTICYQNNQQVAYLNTRANLIQGCGYGADATASIFDLGVGRGAVGATGSDSYPSGVFNISDLVWTDGTNLFPIPVVVVTRRYQVQLALGLMTQEKLIPTKYMASQLAIELTLDTPANCIVADIVSVPAQTGSGPGYIGANSRITYAVSNVNLIPEILEFDACKSCLHNPR